MGQRGRGNKDKKRSQRKGEKTTGTVMSYKLATA